MVIQPLLLQQERGEQSKVTNVDGGLVKDSYIQNNGIAS